MRKPAHTIAAGCAGLLVWGLWISPAAAQCPMCRASLLNSEEGRRLIDGFNSGILLLLAVPALIVLGVCLTLWRKARVQAMTANSGPSGPCNHTAGSPAEDSSSAQQRLARAG
ncbi:MAG TPA: hypothetical protein VNN17_00720 [Terriglobia bacterium]|nr:hypothetical protein [Terriglobia bacterium]